MSVFCGESVVPKTLNWPPLIVTEGCVQKLPYGVLPALGLVTRQSHFGHRIVTRKSHGAGLTTAHEICMARVFLDTRVALDLKQKRVYACGHK